MEICKALLYARELACYYFGCFDKDGKTNHDLLWEKFPSLTMTAMQNWIPASKKEEGGSNFYTGQTRVRNLKKIQANIGNETKFEQTVADSAAPGILARFSSLKFASFKNQPVSVPQLLHGLPDFEGSARKMTYADDGPTETAHVGVIKGDLCKAGKGAHDLLNKAKALFYTASAAPDDAGGDDEKKVSAVPPVSLFVGSPNYGFGLHEDDDHAITRDELKVCLQTFHNMTSAQTYAILLFVEEHSLGMVEAALEESNPR